MFVTAGSDTYGRVKTVAGTPIVTKFAMLQAFPVWPLESFYYIGKSKGTFSGIPLLAWSQTESIRGIPLARIDKLSVLMTYFRAICAILAIPGPILVVTLAVSTIGRRIDGFVVALIVASLIATIAGLLTYALPLMGHREREIRQHCGQLLGLSIDPARVRSEVSSQITSHLDRSRGSDEDGRSELLRRLVKTRAMISQTTDKHRLELATDELLEQLRQIAA
jgi:hypothetical protein